MKTVKPTEKFGSLATYLRPLLKQIKVRLPKVGPVTKANSRRRVWEDYRPGAWSPTSQAPFSL